MGLAVATEGLLEPAPGAADGDDYGSEEGEGPFEFGLAVELVAGDEDAAAEEVYRSEGPEEKQESQLALKCQDDRQQAGCAEDEQRHLQLLPGPGQEIDFEACVIAERRHCTEREEDQGNQDLKGVAVKS